MASNWCVGDKKGLLSGKRYLVLCDNTVWAELRKADADTSGAAVVGGAWDATAGPVGDHYVPGNSQGERAPPVSPVISISPLTYLYIYIYLYIEVYIYVYKYIYLFFQN